MKTINTLEEALAMELENLYFGERKLKESFLKINKIIHSAELRDILYSYTSCCDAKRVKIERIFSYIHYEPHLCTTNVIDELIEESFNRLKFAQDTDVQEQILINGIERINSYKICAYEAALRYAEELDLDVAADLLVTIIQWEQKTKEQLVNLSLHLFSTKDYVA